MNSMGQTAVASIPPAMHPAVMAVQGFLLFFVAILEQEKPKDETNEMRHSSVAAVHIFLSEWHKPSLLLATS